MKAFQEKFKENNQMIKTNLHENEKKKHTALNTEKSLTLASRIAAVVALIPKKYIRFDSM